MKTKPGDGYFRIKKARLRMLKKCKIVGDCWIWQGSRNGEYGSMKIDGQTRNAHRVSYSLFKGQISLGNSIIHTCGNKLCCAPHHLYAKIQEQPLTPGIAAEAA